MYRSTEVFVHVTELASSRTRIQVCQLSQQKLSNSLPPALPHVGGLEPLHLAAVAAALWNSELPESLCQGHEVLPKLVL